MGETASEAPGGGGITVDTLESGRILIRTPDEPVWPAGEGWELQERFRVGSADGDGSHAFSGMVQAAIGSNGELFVLDITGREVLAFGPDGDHLFTLWRRGRGPGELSMPFGFTVDLHGVLWVRDLGNARYSAFDPATGASLGQGRMPFLPNPVSPWPGRFDRSGRLLDLTVDWERHPLVVVLDTAFVPRDTLVLPRLGDQFMAEARISPTSSVRIPAPVPFAPEPHWAPHPDGGIVVGEGHSYRLHRILPTGDTTVTIEVLRPPVPVTRAERDSALASRATRLEGRFEFPTHRPAHGPILVDDEGRIWVQLSKRELAWDLISGNGELLGQVMVPGPEVGLPAVGYRRLALTTIGGMAGVVGVVVYDLVPPGGDGG